MGLKMVWIPAGKFLMGSPAGELGRLRDEGPLTEVVISQGFWIGKYPVTQCEWDLVMRDNPSHFKSAGPRAPVENVSWIMANAFCAKLNSEKGKTQEGMKFRLPYEAEWEYACRAGSRSSLYHQKELTSEYGECPHLDEVAWYNKNSEATTHPVGEKKANDWGLHDCLGNVREWTESRSSFWRKLFLLLLLRGDQLPGGSVKDWRGPESGQSRVLRGGSFLSSAGIARCAMRYYATPSYQDRDFGFRLVLAREVE